MKAIISTLIILFIVSNLGAEELGLRDHLLKFDEKQQIVSSLNQNSSTYRAGRKLSDEEIEYLNPGRALILSAILPGAGQMSVGSNFKAAVFFAIEIAAWTGVIYYYDQGQKKDREFKDYADDHFEELKYRDVEYNLAQNSQWGSPDGRSYPGTEEEWLTEKWEEKIKYLPKEGFTHELPSQDQRRNRSHDQQYYEMIGKYIRQFGFGWDDSFGDLPDTPFFDGESPNSLYYMDMRYDSNKMFDYSSIAIQVALLNHVASALDASFTVRTLKRKAKADLGFRTINYDRQPLAVAGLNISW